MSNQLILDLVNKQANDPAIWFSSTSITESYLQGQIRDLHKVIEDNIK